MDPEAMAAKGFAEEPLVDGSTGYGSNLNQELDRSMFPLAGATHLWVSLFLTHSPLAAWRRRS